MLFTIESIEKGTLFISCINVKKPNQKHDDDGQSVKYALQVKILGKNPKISQKLFIPNMWCSKSWQCLQSPQLPENVKKIIPKIS